MKWIRLLLAGVPLLLALGVVRGLEKVLARKWRAVLLFILVGVVAYQCFAPRPSPPGDHLAPEEVRQLQAALLTRVKRDGPNHSHALRLLRYAPRFADAAGAHADVVRAAALLHDATKENGVEDPKERFCRHGETGAEYAAKVLTGMGKSEAFRSAVATAIREHMGPCGINWRFLGRRFMSRFCSEHRFPRPSTTEAKVLYDIDMLDLMTVDGVLKVVTLRQTNPEFSKETLKESALTGDDSAWKSVVDARQTLLTAAAKECGAALAGHSRAFLDGVDWSAVEDLPAFAQAVAEYKRAHPLPGCLP